METGQIVQFILRNSFELTVPVNYEHKNQLAIFAEFVKDKSEGFYNCDRAITDKNYADATQQLVAGKTYQVKIFSVMQRMRSRDCMAFLASQGAILVGAQGLSLVRQIMKNELPVGKCVASFDEAEALWEDAVGKRRVPNLYRDLDNGWVFGLGNFERYWNENYCLLCFCD